MRHLLTAVVFSVAMAMVASGQTSYTLDHFYCYSTPDTPVLARSVLLQDQFDGTDLQETITDLKIIRFCNPVQKTTSEGLVTHISHAADHLTMYWLNPVLTAAAGPLPAVSTPRIVFIRNQFGEQVLRTTNPVVLAVPTGKTFPVPTANATPPAIPTDLDHFKCYLASGRDPNRPLILNDQFTGLLATQGALVRMVQPILFCNPVKKTIPNTPPTITPIQHPTDAGTTSGAHLACYLLTQHPFSGTLLMNNQFTSHVDVTPLQVGEADILCVPTFKLRFATILPPTTVVEPDEVEAER